MFSTIENLFSRRFRHLATMRGHSGPVISLAFSANGNFLASGGADGVKIWDLKTKKEVDIPQQAYNERAQVSCVCWVTRKNETFDTLCYGNALGFLVFLQHRPTESRFEAVHSSRIARGGEILNITADTSGNDSTRIATCTRDKCVQVWLFNSGTCKLVPAYSKVYKEEKGIVPKALAFDDNVDRDLFVFGLYDGGLYKYGGKDAASISKYQLGSQIGNAAVDLERRLCVIDNVGNGFDIYKIDSGNFVKTLVTKDPLKTFPKGVAFANYAHAVIGGSDHGRVYIFDRKTARVVKTLKHAREGGAETIAVYDSNDGSTFIATASSTASGPSPIVLWKWTQARKRGELGNLYTESWTLMGLMEILVKIVMMVATCAYVFEFFNKEILKAPATTQNTSWLMMTSWLNGTSVLKGKVGKWL